VSAPQLLDRAIANLEETYCAVGSRGDGAHIERRSGLVRCTSSLDHPVSNFAIVRDLSAENLEACLEPARSRPAFNIYLMPGAAAEDRYRDFQRTGLEAVGRLSILVADPAPKANAPRPAVVEAFEDRLRVTRFMARQFFGRQSSSVREKIMLATAKANVELLRNPGPELVAAGMVCHTPGMYGIYNFCVGSEFRERGHGSELLSGMCELAREMDEVPTLQCDGYIEPWYLGRGFRSIGLITVLALAKKASHAIM
jgi:hypothetical protein